MRSRKTAAAIAVLLLTFVGLGTPAKSATLKQTLTAIQANYVPATFDDLEVSTQNQIICLALNQYHEARGSTEADIKAVGYSTRNRVLKSPAQDYCATIWERGQYVWTTRGVSGILPREKASWSRMLDYARQIVTDDDQIDPTGGADSFFSRKIGVPRWAHRSPIHQYIGAHIYVRMLR
jgi:N-acetylmuramoyl-L-alanine amidase